MSEARTLTIQQAARALRSGTLTAEALLQSCLARIDAREGQVQAWAHLDREGALERARALDREAARGRWHGPLHGIPLGVKDVIDVGGMPTTAGSPAYAARVAEADATAVGRLRAAGGVLLGKTVTTPFANGDAQPTRNPWDLERSPGGSSSGSGAAVGDRMVAAALGTQSGGSVLRPAAFCGVVGFKPSTGQTDLAGVVPNVTELDHIGVIAKSVGDAHLVFQAYRDEPWSHWEVLPERLPPALLPRTPRRLWRVRGYFEEQCSAEVLDGFDAICRRLTEAGVELVEQDLPPAFEGIHRAHKLVAGSVIAQYSHTVFAEKPQIFGPRLTETLQVGLAATALEFLNGQRQRRALRGEMLAALSGVDGAVMPACPTPPTPADITGDASFLSPWSFTGLPAVSLPSGRFSDGLPQAVQLLGILNSDEHTLGTAQWIEDILAFDAAPK